MCSTGSWLGQEADKASVSFGHFELGPRITARLVPFADRHFFPLIRVGADRLVDKFVVSIHRASTEGGVPFFDCPGGKLSRQFQVSFIRFRHEDDSARISIQAVYDAWTMGTAHGTERLEMMSQAAGQSA
jgi:hypothetical protein